jgi:ABC-2 type transport system permease protein
VNIFWHELRTYRRTTIIWAASLSMLVVVFMSMFPAFTIDVNQTKDLLQHLPGVVRDAFGISLHNFFSIYGFFSYLLSFVAIAGAIQSMNLGVGILSKEEANKTIDFLLTKPVARKTVVTSKLLAAICLLLMTNIVFLIVSTIAAAGISKDSLDIGLFVQIGLILGLIQLIFMSLGFMLAVIIPKIKSVISVSLPTVFSFFIIGSFGTILGNDNVKYLSPFKFFDPQYIISNGHIDPKFLLIEAACVIVLIAASYLLFIKKDIRAAS